MSNACQCEGIKVEGFSAHKLTNRDIECMVIPELGGKIFSLVYRPLGRDVLWHNREIQLAPVEYGAKYDPVFTGGWDEVFPNDEEANYEGLSLPDHGEIWSIPWQSTVVEERSSISLNLEVFAPVTKVRLIRRVSLRKDEPKIYFRHWLRNEGTESFPYLWKLHPSFAISPHHRIDLPTNLVRIEPEDSTELIPTVREFVWPVQRDGQGNSKDLRIVPPESKRTSIFAYCTGLEQGWFALTDLKRDLGFALAFPKEHFPNCWIFASYGGWRSHYCLLLEPSSGYPYQLVKAFEAGTCPILSPGKTIECESVGTFYRGLHEVCSVSPEGSVQGAA